jgi:hypothetical protein
MGVCGCSRRGRRPRRPGPRPKQERVIKGETRCFPLEIASRLCRGNRVSAEARAIMRGRPFSRDGRKNSVILSAAKNPSIRPPPRHVGADIIRPHASCVHSRLYDEILRSVQDDTAECGCSRRGRRPRRPKQRAKRPRRKKAARSYMLSGQGMKTLSRVMSESFRAPHMVMVSRNSAEMRSM